MAKRTATNELTDRNWDDEEEPEEAGQFVQASDAVIKGREIKKAKRRGAAGGNEEGSSVFSGFSGFKSISSGATTTKPSLSAFTDKTKNGSNTDVNNSSKRENGKTDKSETDYLANLKSLNESVVTWIKQHVDKNPFCILSPIFKDYEKHLEELEKEKKENKSKTTEESKTEEKDSKPKVSAGSGFTFSTNGTSGSKFGGFGSTSGFNFGTTTTTASSGFSFGTATTSTSSAFSTATTATTGFSFGTKPATSGFTFGTSTVSTASTSTSQAKTGDDEDEYVPPTVEVSEVKEEGAFYTKRGKLFYQKEGKWTERGVGNIHLKKVEEKVQLVIRADTNLGNILLNIMLTDGIPVKKQGKNNIFFVCVPNPPFDAKAEENKPVPILLRVKTSEDAEEFIAKVEENRK